MTRFRTIFFLAIVTYFVTSQPVHASGLQSPASLAASELVASLDGDELQRLRAGDQLPGLLFRDDQFGLYANFVKAQGTYQAMGVLTPGMKSSKIVAVPIYINLILAASVQVGMGDQMGPWVPIYKYSQPANLTPQAPGGGPNFNTYPTPGVAREIAVSAVNFGSVPKLKRAPYPTNVPIPEVAYRRRVSLPFAMLSRNQQQFVQAAVAASGTPLPRGFNWHYANVRFGRTLTFHGQANRGNIQNARFNSFNDLVW